MPVQLILNFDPPPRRTFLPRRVRPSLRWVALRNRLFDQLGEETWGAEDDHGEVEVRSAVLC